MIPNVQEENKMWVWVWGKKLERDSWSSGCLCDAKETGIDRNTDRPQGNTHILGAKRRKIHRCTKRWSGERGVRKSDPCPRKESFKMWEKDADNSFKCYKDTKKDTVVSSLCTLVTWPTPPPRPRHYPMPLKSESLGLRTKAQVILTWSRMRTSCLIGE